MSKIITTNLGDLVPNRQEVRKGNLEKVRRDWSSKSVEDGSWLEVWKVDTQLYIADGDHRCYIAYFYKRIQTARVTLMGPEDYELHPIVNNQDREIWNRLLTYYRSRIQDVNSSGVYSIRDLENRIED